MESNTTTSQGSVKIGGRRINLTVTIDESPDLYSNLDDEDCSDIVTSSPFVSGKMAILVQCIDNLASQSESGIRTRLRDINRELHLLLRESYIRFGSKLVREIFDAHELLQSGLSRCSNPSTRRLINEYHDCITAIALECLENA